MAEAPKTSYANVVNIRLTPAEFVLEFGAHFPDRPGQGPPSDYRPDLRVVLPAGAINGILHALNQAVQQRQGQVAAAQSKAPVGFQKPDRPDGSKDKS
jgi:hypothetical protein